MKQKNEITAQTKQNLMEAFWALYREKRVDKITVREITAKAGYNRGTFYEYFSDVYDVLEQIESSLIPSLEELPFVSTSTGSFGQPFDPLFALYKKNSQYYYVLMGERGDPAFATKLKNSIKPTLLRFFIDQPNVDLNELDYILEYTLSAMIGVMSFWYRQPKPLSYEKFHELLNRLMDQGITKQFGNIHER